MKIIKTLEEMLANMNPDDLEGLMAAMQQELEKKKNEPKNDEFPNTQHKEQLDKAQHEMGEFLKTVIADGAAAVSVAMSCTAFDGNGTAAVCVLHSLDDLNEDGLSAALDVFTNPRRIAVLKLLIPAGMGASEISKKTGLIGGQLYHHLACLENAGLIVKYGDTYRAKADTTALLCSLNAAVGGTKIAAMGNDYINEAPAPESQDDALFYKALEYAFTEGEMSTSALQRHFRIGYNRAARLMAKLEKYGIKPRNPLDSHNN
jgi:DNA segregation ATPase FtsK/SpoIIIE-like protein